VDRTRPSADDAVGVRVYGESAGRVGPRGERALAVALGVAGLLAVAIGTFLPLWSTAGIADTTIPGNSLLRSGHGWLVLGACGFGLFALVRARRGGAGVWWLTLTGLLVIGYAVWAGVVEDPRIVCPPGGASLFGGDCRIATPGIGVFAVGGGGVALATSGIWFVRRRHGAGRACPECAEPVRVGVTRCPSCRREVALSQPTDAAP
jgi:hypothetical protein